MERPFKRPRFSFLSNNTPSSYELDHARNNNDIRLKSRFESIFQKYEHDFEGIGDEIDLETGQIVVDNGHLVSMRDEQDIGAIQGGTRFGGGSLLRAMTVAPEEQQIALDSIEEDATGRSLADTLAALGSFNSPIPINSEDEEDLLGTPLEDRSDDEDSLLGDSMKVDGSPHRTSPVEWTTQPETIDAGTSYSEFLSRFGSRSKVAPPEQPIQSSRVRSDDEDSMLGDMLKVEDTGRQADTEDLTIGEPNSDSDDSLLGQPERPLDSNDTSPDIDGGQDQRGPPTDDAIMRQFGPEVGPKVMEILTRRNLALEAAIEPAWRVPDIGRRLAPPPKIAAPLSSTSNDAFVHASPEKHSLWAQPKPRRRDHRQAMHQEVDGSARYEPQRPTVRSTSVFSTESIDPLQDDLVERVRSRSSKTQASSSSKDHTSARQHSTDDALNGAILIPCDSPEDHDTRGSYGVRTLLGGAASASSESSGDSGELETVSVHYSSEGPGAVKIAAERQPARKMSSSEKSSGGASMTVRMTTNSRDAPQMLDSDADNRLVWTKVRKANDRTRSEAEKDPRAVEAQLNKYKTSPEEFKLLMRLREVDGVGWEAVYPYFPNHTGRQLNDWMYRYWSGSKAHYRGPKMPPWTEDDDHLLELLKARTNLSWENLLAFFPGRKLCHVAPRLAKLWLQDMLPERRKDPPIDPSPTDTSQSAPGDQRATNPLLAATSLEREVSQLRSARMSQTPRPTSSSSAS